MSITLGYQTHNQGSTAGLTLCEPHDHAYSLSLHHLIAKPSLHSSTSPHSIRSDVYQAWHTPRLLYNDAFFDPKPQTTVLLSADMATSDAVIADLPRLVEIEFAAFRDEKVNHHLSYRDASEQTHVRRALRTYRKYMNNIRIGSLAEKTPARREFKISGHEAQLGFRFRKVSLPGSSQIVAFCKSEMVALTPKDMTAPLDCGHEGEPQMNRDWFALNEKLHRQYCGMQKHCYFGMLATHPSFQHRGAASKLMDELMAEADRLGVEVYCEATKTGRPLYEKYGFVAVKDIEFPTADYGSDFGVEHQTVMVRGALGTDGSRNRVRSWEEALAASTKAMLDAGLSADCILD